MIPWIVATTAKHTIILSCVPRWSSSPWSIRCNHDQSGIIMLHYSTVITKFTINSSRESKYYRLRISFLESMALVKHAAARQEGKIYLHHNNDAWTVRGTGNFGTFRDVSSHDLFEGSCHSSGEVQRCWSQRNELQSKFQILIQSSLIRLTVLGSILFRVISVFFFEVLKASLVLVVRIQSHYGVANLLNTGYTSFEVTSSTLMPSPTFMMKYVIQFVPYVNLRSDPGIMPHICISNLGYKTLVGIIRIALNAPACYTLPYCSRSEQIYQKFN